MKLTLPYPPTANTYWRVWRGRAVKSTEARAYQATVKLLAYQALGAVPRPLAGEVCVTLSLYRPRRLGDLDNTLKVLLDALKGVAFEDDSQVVEIHATRAEDKASPRVEVTVEARP